MNLKQRREMNRAHRRIILNTAKNKFKAKVLEHRLREEITAARANELFRAIDACKNIGAVYRTKRRLDVLVQIKDWATP